MQLKRRTQIPSSPRPEKPLVLFDLGEAIPPQLTQVECHELYRQLHDGFARKPDSANILQGVRPFRKGKPHVRVTLFASEKNGRAMIPCEGRLEAKMALSLEIDPDVRRYRSQPIELPPVFGTTLVPDFAAEHHDGTFTIIDVKPAGRLASPSVTNRMRNARTILKQARLPHRLSTECDLEEQPALQIREALKKGAAVEIEAIDRQLLLAFLRRSPRSVQEIRKAAVALGLNPYSVEKLALLGDVTFPTNKFWSDFAQLEISHGTNQTTSADRGSIRDVRVTL